MPIRFSLRQTMRHGCFKFSVGTNSVEPVRDEKRGNNFERRSGLRKVPNDAINSAAAELNRSGLQNATTSGDSVFVHKGIIGRISQAELVFIICYPAAYTLENTNSVKHIRTMQTCCPKCSTMVKSVGTEWKIINGSCPELVGTQVNGKPEYCPVLSA
jgi:hypothetical protein